MKKSKEITKKAKEAIDSLTAVVWDEELDSRHVWEYDGRTNKLAHTCLQYGFWCWKNVFEHPKDIENYFRIRIQRWLNSE